MICSLISLKHFKYFKWFYLAPLCFLTLFLYFIFQFFFFFLLFFYFTFSRRILKIKLLLIEVFLMSYKTLQSVSITYLNMSCQNTYTGFLSLSKIVYFVLKWKLKILFIWYVGGELPFSSFIFFFHFTLPVPLICLILFHCTSFLFSFLEYHKIC